MHGHRLDADSDGYVDCTLDAGGWDGPGNVIGGDDCDDSDPLAFPGSETFDEACVEITGCGCATGSGGPTTAMLLAGLLGALMLRRRREDRA